MKSLSRTSCTLLLIVTCVVLGAITQAHAQQRRRTPRRPAGAAVEADAGAAPAEQAAPIEPTPSPVAPDTAATPAVNPADTATQPAPTAPVPAEELVAAGPDLAPLREEYTAIMDELVKARARVALIGKALFKTKVRIVIQNRAGDAQSLEKLVLRLDGAPIYRKDGAAGLEEGEQVFEGFATPGPHALDLEADQHSRANDGFGYTLRETFRFAVQKDRLTEITIVLDDDSDMAEDFPDDGEGEYDVRTRVTAATYELEAR